MTHNNTTPTQTQQNITHTHTHTHTRTQHNTMPPPLPLLSAFDTPSLSFRIPRVAQGVSIADPEHAAVLDGAVEGRAASMQMLRDNRPGRSTAAPTLAEVYSTHLQGIGCVANFLPIPCP